MKALENAFELSSWAASEDAQASLAEHVDHALRQRRLRPHHRERHLLAQRELGQCIGLGERHVLEPRVGGGTAVARCHVDTLHLGALRQLPGQRVLAAAAADDEYLHVSAARPPEGTDAPPRGAANEVSVGASSYVLMRKNNIQLT
jgi:hypothetical protein